MIGGILLEMNGGKKQGLRRGGLEVLWSVPPSQKLHVRTCMKLEMLGQWFAPSPIELQGELDYPYWGRVCYFESSNTDVVCLARHGPQKRPTTRSAFPHGPSTARLHLDPGINVHVHDIWADKLPIDSVPYLRTVRSKSLHVAKKACVSWQALHQCDPHRHWRKRGLGWEINKMYSVPPMHIRNEQWCLRSISPTITPSL